MEKGLSVLFVLVAIAELVGFDYLMASNKEVTVFLQSFKSPSLDSFFEVFGFVTTHCFQLLGCIDYLGGNRERGLVGALTSFMAIAVFSFVKNLYGHPRPSWVYPEIHTGSCSAIWGFPSGHTLCAAAVLYFYSHFWRHPVSQASMVVFALLVGLDRVYLGLHSYSQVICGFVLGLILAKAFIELYEQKLIERLANNPRVWLSVYLFIGLVWLVGGLVHFVDPPQVDPLWAENFQRRCGFPLDATQVNLKMLSGLSAMTMCCGLVHGYLRHKPMPHGTAKHYLSGIIVMCIFFPMVLAFEKPLLRNVTWTSLAILTIARGAEGYILGAIPKLTEYLMSLQISSSK